MAKKPAKKFSVEIEEKDNGEVVVVLTNLTDEPLRMYTGWSYADGFESRMTTFAPNQRLEVYHAGPG
jgi:hypothetical protein